MQVLVQFSTAGFVYDGSSTSITLSLYRFGVQSGTSADPLNPKWIDMASGVTDVIPPTSNTTVTGASLDDNGNLTVDFTTVDPEGTIESFSGNLIIGNV